MYIANQKITLTESNVEKHITTVTLENGEVRKIPDEIYEAIVTDEPSDLTTLRSNYVRPLVAKILKILLDANLPLEYEEYVYQLLRASLEDCRERALAKLWGKPYHSVNLGEINDVLTRE